ncbi:MAG: c-type cytochrome [Hyphomicrobium sp.]
MDSFELSKIGGAVCAALLLIFLPPTLGEIFGGKHGPQAVGFALPAPEGAASAEAAHADKPAPAAAAQPTAPAAGAAKAGAAPVATAETKPEKSAATAATGFDSKAVTSLLAAASVDAGKAAFTKCGACHSVEKGAANKVGPNLWNVVGRTKGGKEDFNGYSASLKAKGGAWTLEDMASFIHSPKGFVANTKMVFPGVKEPAAIAELVAYIRTLSDAPVPLPK